MKRVSAALSALLLCVAMLAAVAYGVGTSAGVMEALMRRYAPPEETGLPAEQYAPMARMITAYLKGEGDFQLVYSVRGAEIVAFNAREQAHMADVQELFRLAKWVLVLGGMALPLLGLSLWRMGRGLLRGIRKGLIVILALVGIVAIWAAVDFNRLFILFHQIAFTNDLWLLNPRTDLLIRLMPIEFFVSYAALIGGLWLLGMIGLLILATHRIKITKVE